MARLSGAIAAGILLFLAASVSGRQTSPDNNALSRQAEQRIRELQAEADRLAAQSSTLLGELRSLQIEREIKREALKKADAALADISAAVARGTTRVADLESRRIASSAGLRERLVEIYKRGRSGYVGLLFAADDLRALGRLSRAVAAVARLDRVRVDEHRRMIHAERDALAELEKRRQVMAAAQEDARHARAALDAAVAAHNRRIDELDRRRDLTAQYVGELQHAAAAMERRIGDLTSGRSTAVSIEPFRGALDWPLAGAVVSRFGAGTTRVGGRVVRSGIEIAAAEGAEVRVVHPGIVSFAAPFIGFGTLVIVDHGGNDFTVYAHLQQATVADGARVERGAVVGRAGRNPDGAEVVYFEVRVDGRPVDPLQWLKAAP